MSYLMVFIGAGIGGVLRYLASTWVQKLSGAVTLPLGTAFVNILGCLLIGILAQMAETKALFTPEVRLLVMVGILGGFTTFSTFGYETFQLLGGGQYLEAILTVVTQVVVGVVCVALGYSLGRFL